MGCSLRGVPLDDGINLHNEHDQSGQLEQERQNATQPEAVAAPNPPLAASEWGSRHLQRPHEQRQHPLALQSAVAPRRQPEQRA